MKCTVIIPVGPGHEKLAREAVDSVYEAARHSPGPFSGVELALVDDLDGKLGRSRARNMGMDDNPSDWFFLMDADDRMMPDTFMLVALSQPATFGTILLAGKVGRENRWPVTRDTLFEHGAVGTLAMGCFVRGDLGIRFDESLDIGEDFDFYMRLPGFTKLQVPLVNIGYRTPSAGGPRSPRNGRWREACRAVIERYR
jgi:hypothetical protein